METGQNTTREDFMAFFRDTEKLNELTPDDRAEILRTVSGNYFNKSFHI